MPMELNRLLSGMVRKSFPELAGHDITAVYEDVLLGEDSYCYYYSKRGRFFIALDATLERTGRKVIIGALAHELCHVLWEVQNSVGYGRNDYRLYETFFMHRQRDEQYTDLQTVLRGYGKELKMLMDHYHRHPTKEYSEGKYCGLTSKDLRKMGF